MQSSLRIPCVYPCRGMPLEYPKETVEYPQFSAARVPERVPRRAERTPGGRSARAPPSKPERDSESCKATGHGMGMT
jgi:hypothetical protein